MRQKFNESELSEKREIQKQRQQRRQQEEKMSGKKPTAKAEQQQPLAQQQQQQHQVSFRPTGGAESPQQQQQQTTTNQRRKHSPTTATASAQLQQGGSQVKKIRKASVAANGNTSSNSNGAASEKRAKMQRHQQQQQQQEQTEPLGATQAANSGEQVARVAGVGNCDASINSVELNGTVTQMVTSGNKQGSGGSNNSGELITRSKENICAACLKPIKERYLLVALNKQWHEDCLKCACCDCRLGEVGSTLYQHSDKMLCRRDYLRIFGQHGHCAACKKSIPPYELVMRANENAYHMDCFACQQCQYRFCVGDRFHLTDSHRIVCIMCHTDAQQRQAQQQQPHHHHHHHHNNHHNQHHHQQHQEHSHLIQHQNHHHHHQQSEHSNVHQQSHQPTQSATFSVSQAQAIPSAATEPLVASAPSTATHCEQLDTRLAQAHGEATTNTSRLELISSSNLGGQQTKQQTGGELAGLHFTSGGSTKNVLQSQSQSQPLQLQPSQLQNDLTEPTARQVQQQLPVAATGLQPQQQIKQQQQTAACAM